MEWTIIHKDGVEVVEAQDELAAFEACSYRLGLKRCMAVVIPRLEPGLETPGEGVTEMPKRDGTGASNGPVGSYRYDTSYGWSQAFTTVH